MNETFVSTRILPGDRVNVDPRLEHLLAINLLDREPEPGFVDLEPIRFHRSASRAEERVPVLAR